MTALSVVQKQEPERGSGELSVAETAELSQFETVIEKNLRGFYEVGTALAKIRDSRLYRETHDTFQDYCWDRWEISWNYAYKQMASSQVIDNLKSCTIVQRPTNEAQARPLTQLETPELQQEAWLEAVRTAPDGKVTGDHVYTVVNEMIYPKTEESQKETRPLCEKCRIRKVEKKSKTGENHPSGLCTRCRKEERELKQLQEAQAEWDKIPINPEAEQYWSELVEVLEKVFSAREIPIVKIGPDVLKQVANFQHKFNRIVNVLVKKSFRNVQGGG